MLPNILCVIPSRLKSTRLPNKPIINIAGKPMIQWVYEGAIKCKKFAKIIVATDSQKIAEIIQNIGGCVEMTPSDLPSGTDRVAYVAEKYPEYDVVVNLQGDEPFIRKDMLDSLVEPFFNGINPVMATLGCPLDFDTEYTNPNMVKVIHNIHNYAIYFSRAPIPFFRQQNIPVPILLHLGLYAFTRDYLLKFSKFDQAALEKCELLEQLRALENGDAIYVSKTTHRIIEINDREDLEAAVKYAEENRNLLCEN